MRAESQQSLCWDRVVLIDKTKQIPLMMFLTIKRDVPRTRSAAGSGRSRDGLAATARRPRLAHSLHPPLSGSATFAEDTASYLRLPILTAWRREPLATSVRTSRSRPTSAAFAEPCARFFTRLAPLLLWFAWFPAFDLV